MTILIAVMSTIWLASLAAAVLGLRWSMAARARNFWAALISSCVSLAIAYVGLSHFQLSWSETVNGDLRWSLNSKWFFVASMIVGAAALVLAFWNRKKARVM